MKFVVAAVAFSAVLTHCFASLDGLGRVFLVLVTEEEASEHRGPFILEDYYCLDPVLPREQSSCRISVLAPKNGVYAESRIYDMYLDFQHPSRTNTVCHVRWPPKGSVRTWCERANSGNRRQLPKFWTETARSGEVSYYDLIQSEKKCDNRVRTIKYYRDGLNGYPDRRPAVVFRTASSGCVAGIVSGRRANNFRTTETPCVYNNRRRCRPLRKDQYDALVRDIDASEVYADFRTSSERPHRRP